MAVRGGDDVQSQTSIAAAACFLASIQFVGGSCASMAFASPEQGHRRDTGGALSDDTGTPSADPTTATPKGDVLARTGAHRPTGKQTPQLGDGRNGLVDKTKTRVEPVRPSNRSEDESDAVSQTEKPRFGEHDGGERGARASRVASGAADVDEKGAGERLPASAIPERAGNPTDEPYIDPADPKGEGEEEPQHPGWHFPCWWPIPDPGQPPTRDGGGGGGAKVPSGRPAPVPPMQLPIPLPLPNDLAPDVPGIPVEPILHAGLGTAASELPFVPVSLPVIVMPPLPAPGARPGINVPPATGKTGDRPATPAENAPPNPPTFSAGGNLAPVSPYRAGYVDYLRAAGLGQVAAVAVPGLAGILVLTGVGGLLGYRQARAGHTVRASGTGRFMG